MRQRKRWQYYCGFCKKNGGSKYHIQEHEKHCTANPDRFCRMCAKADLEQNSTADLVTAAFNGIKRLRDEAQGCPACMLTGLRQMTTGDREDMSQEDANALNNWSFKDAVDSYDSDFYGHEDYEYTPPDAGLCHACGHVLACCCCGDEAERGEG